MTRKGKSNRKSPAKASKAHAKVSKPPAEEKENVIDSSVVPKVDEKTESINVVPLPPSKHSNEKSESSPLLKASMEEVSPVEVDNGKKSSESGVAEQQDVLVPLATSEVRSTKNPEFAQGLTLAEDGEASFSVWAPHASAAFLRLESPPLLVPLERNGDHFSTRLVAGQIKHGERYRIELDAYDQRLIRRDLFARETEYESDWCVAHDDSHYEWKVVDWKRPEFFTYIIYEMHVGSFTPEGTFAAAAEKFDYIKKLGFTCVQVMPILEHADEWGYNPRQFFSMHGAYGTPDDFKEFVDAAHQVGLAVIVDIVLHHASVKLNALWKYDGWEEFGNGGIYFEGSADTEWGRSLAHWKQEVMHMLRESCAQWLTVYHCDGLRFDSANDLSHDLCRALTAHAHGVAPGAFLTAEVTPENPQAVHDLGFDNLWVHSAYFDIIHQHRALGRGQHGGGEFAAGWDFPRLRTVMGLHYGFTSPTQCTKYVLGSHDQIGDKNGGCIYEDYKMIGGRHRYSCDQFGAGRDDEWARSASRAWWAANTCAAGIPMLFMGSEWMACAWWDTWHRRADWKLAEDSIGEEMRACVTDTLATRKKYIALQIGGTNTLHEDRNNGVLAVDRIWEGQRIVIVINAGRGAWQHHEYRVWVGGNAYGLREVLCTADNKYGGWKDQHGNSFDSVIGVYDGFANINVPSQSTMIFETVPS